MLNWLSLSPTSETRALFTLPDPAATRQSVLKQLELPSRVKGGVGERNEREVSQREKSWRKRESEKHRERQGWMQTSKRVFESFLS